MYGNARGCWLERRRWTDTECTAMDDICVIDIWESHAEIKD